MPRKYRIKKHDLIVAAREERKEHPWMTQHQAVHTAHDHLEKHPNYNTALGVAEKIMEKKEQSMESVRKHRRNPERLFGRSKFPY